MAMLSAPSIISAIDNTIDVSALLSFAEEEEEKEGKGNKNIEIFLCELNKLNTDFDALRAQNKLKYYLKKYSKPHLNLISPPPELHLL